MRGHYNTEDAAKSAADTMTHPYVVRYHDGSYDWFPEGEPVGTIDRNGNFNRAPGSYYSLVAKYTFGGWHAQLAVPLE